MTSEIYHVKLIPIFSISNHTGTYVKCDFDFSSEWRSYYDSRPETFGNGKDIVLRKGFMTADTADGQQRRTSFSFQRQVSFNQDKDLAGILSELIMSELVKVEKLQHFRYQKVCVFK